MSTLRTQLKSWTDSAKPWIQRDVVLASVCFLGLNATDGWLTNQACQIVTQSGMPKSIEANPFLTPVAGSWMLLFKGLLGMVILGVLARVRKATPQRFVRWLILSCAVFLGVIVWNLYALGVIG